MMTQSKDYRYSVYHLRYYKAAPLAEQALKPWVANEDDKKEPESIQNVNDLLEDLIRQSVTLVGKLGGHDDHDDRVRAIHFGMMPVHFCYKIRETKFKLFFASPNIIYSYIDVIRSK